MIETKYKLTNKIDPTMSIEATFTGSDTMATDVTAPEAKITFTDEAGNGYVFLKEDVNVEGVGNMSNPDWTIEQL